MSDRTIILVVEDDDTVAEMMVDHLSSVIDAEVVRTCTAAETLSFDLESAPDLMLIDIILPDGNGLDLVRLIRSTRQYPVVVMTGEPTLSRAIDALRVGACDFVAKPFDLERLTTVVQEALADYRKRKDRNRRLRCLERLNRKVVAERKALQERMDLVCKDLVHAYRDLADRVATELEPPHRSRRT